MAGTGFDFVAFQYVCQVRLTVGGDIYTSDRKLYYIVVVIRYSILIQRLRSKWLLSRPDRHTSNDQ